MKKVLTVVLILVIIASLSACANSRESSPESKNTYEFEGVIVTIPDDFSVVEDGTTTIARPDSYPDKTDNINFAKAGKDSADNYDKKSLEENYKSVLSGFTGISRFERKSIDGNDSIVITYGVKYEEFQMIQSSVFIFLEDKSVIITYASVSGSYDDEFESSIENIAVVK